MEFVSLIVAVDEVATGDGAEAAAEADFDPPDFTAAGRLTGCIASFAILRRLSLVHVSD